MRTKLKWQVAVTVAVGVVATAAAVLYLTRDGKPMSMDT